MNSCNETLTISIAMLSNFGLGSYLLISMLQDAPFGMPALIVVEVLSNLPVPLVFELLSSVPLWNKKVENYIWVH
jgi:hypothetical protein